MRKLIFYFLLAYAITWVIWSPLWLPHFGIRGLPVFPYQHYLGSFGPMIAAFIVQYATKGKEGINDLWQRITRWRVAPVWYFVVLGGPLMVFMSAALIAHLTTGQWYSLLNFGTNDEFPDMAPPVYFLFNLFTFGFGEEIGWRGFALPVLQRRFNAFWATVFLTFGWAAWHTPAFLYRPLYSSMDLGGIIGFFFSMFTGSILLTWIYNSTRGSILMVALFHAMIEMIFMSNGITPRISMYEGAILSVLAVLILLIAKPLNLSRVERQIDLH